MLQTGCAPAAARAAACAHTSRRRRAACAQLACALRFSHLAVCRACVRVRVSQFGGTALMGASRDGHASIVQLLLDNRADVNAKDNSGWTALDYARVHKHSEVVALLEAAHKVRSRVAAAAVSEGGRVGREGKRAAGGAARLLVRPSRVAWPPLSAVPPRVA